MIRLICFIIVCSAFGTVCGADTIYRDDVLAKTLASSIMDFVYDTENEIDLKLSINKSSIYDFSICADGIDLRNIELPDSTLRVVTYFQGERGTDFIAKPFKKYLKKGVYVIFPYQVLSGDKLIITLTLRKLQLNTDDNSIAEQTIKRSQYTYILSEEDLSWHFYSKTKTALCPHIK